MPPRPGTVISTLVRSQNLWGIVTGSLVTVTSAPGWPQACRNAAGTLTLAGAGSLPHAAEVAAAAAASASASPAGKLRPGQPRLMVTLI